jgi:hypothetical protein
MAAVKAATENVGKDWFTAGGSLGCTTRKRRAAGWADKREFEGEGRKGGGLERQTRRRQGPQRTSTFLKIPVLTLVAAPWQFS